MSLLTVLLIVNDRCLRVLLQIVTVVFVVTETVRVATEV